MHLPKKELKLKLNLDFLERSPHYSRKIKLKLSPGHEKLHLNSVNKLTPYNMVHSKTLRNGENSTERTVSRENINENRNVKLKSKRLKINLLYQNLIKINNTGRLSRSSDKDNPNTYRDHSDRELCNVTFLVSSKHLQNQIPVKNIPSDVFYDSLKRAFQEQDGRKVAGFVSRPSNLRVDYLMTLKGQSLDFLAGKSLNLQPLYLESQFLKKKFSMLNYKVLKCIGAGGFAKVYLVRSKLNGKFYAMKLIKKQLITQQRRQVIIQIERNIMVNVDHPFLIKLEQAFESNDFVVFIMQYCPGGQFFTYIKKYNKLEEETARFYFVQILLGIQYLHNHSIIYRDIKPQNILLDLEGHVRISDFGLSKPNMFRNQKAYSFCGSPEYMSPEMILKEGHSFPVDYYCLGALLYEMVTGLPPFYSRNTQQIYEAVITEEVSFPRNIPLSLEIKSLMKALLNKNPKARLGSMFGVKQILAHPWFGKIKRETVLQKKLIPPIVINNAENLSFKFGNKDKQASLRDLIEAQYRPDRQKFRKIFNQSFYFQKGKQEAVFEESQRTLRKFRSHDQLRLESSKRKTRG